MTYPRPRLDPVIHAPVRLSIMGLLLPADNVAFGSLRDTLGVSDALLSKHLRALERAGYVEIRKGSSDHRPHTWVAVSYAGRSAFASYLDALRQVVGMPLAPDVPPGKKA